jgi:hypothetical protein
MDCDTSPTRGAQRNAGGELGRRLSVKQGGKNPSIPSGITFMSKFLKISVVVLKLKHEGILTDMTIQL